MRITAIIVARGGSKRLPNKALLPFGDSKGSTLVGHKAATLCQTHRITDVVCGSDSREILAAAAWGGAGAIERDAFHCDESRATANDMIADMVRRIEPCDHVLWAHPTNPLIKPETYDRAIAEYLDKLKRGYDSLCSVFSIKRHAWVDGKPWNYDPWALKHVVAAHLRPICFQDGAIFIQPYEQMKSNSYFFGETPWLFEIDHVEGWDIDTEADYRAALALYQSIYQSSNANA